MANDNEVEDFLNRSLTIVEEFEQGYDVTRKIETLALPAKTDADILEVYRVVRDTCSQSPITNSFITTPRQRSRAIRIPKLDLDQLNGSRSQVEQSTSHLSCCHSPSHATSSVSIADFIYLMIFILFISALIFLFYPPHRYCGPV
ncbi:unnamed protein product [Auanema sp. JU1783]|nr:unnamed protein product [Auanema sp. JU1783]